MRFMVSVSLMRLNDMYLKERDFIEHCLIIHLRLILICITNAFSSLSKVCVHSLDT